jgi:hypothetical protein
MKKLCAIFLAALMLLTVLPMAAFAKVDKADQIITEILNNSNYQHMSYTKDKGYFKAALITYSVFNADTWGSQIKGDTFEAKAAKTALLALIDKIEAELNNETYEKILAGLKGAKTAMELVGKVNDLTGKLDFAASEGWSNALTGLNTAIKLGSIANDEYEKYAEGYAIILSCQAASSYYGALLDYIADHVEDDNIANAARELKANITMSMEEASKKLMKEIGDDVGQQGTLLAIDLAMNTNSVTAIIKTVYGVAGSLGDKLFKATDKAMYQAALAALTRMEDVLPTYIRSELNGTDPLAAEFAKISILTLRESGETMLSNLGKVTSSSIGDNIFGNAEEAKALSQSGAIAAIKLGVYHDIFMKDAEYTSYLIQVDTTSGKNLNVRGADGYAVATLRNNRESRLLNDDGAFYSIFDGTVGKYVRVVVTFIPNCRVELTNASTNSSGSSGSSSSGKSGGIFADFFAAIAAFFANLFSFFK